MVEDIIRIMMMMMMILVIIIIITIISIIIIIIVLIKPALMSDRYKSFIFFSIFRPQKDLER